MSKPLSYTVRAGRLLRLLGWLYAVLFVGIALAITIPQLAMSKAIEGEFLGLMLGAVALFGFMIAMYFVVGSALKQYRWRGGALVLALFAAFNFPVGTIIAAALFYYLVSGWNETADLERHGELPLAASPPGRIPPQL